MILYHGSNMVFKTPFLAKCSPYKDFGQGFCLSDSFDVARRTAFRVVRQRGGKPVVLVVVYKSPFFLKLQDPETGLYRESKAYLIRRFNQECQ